jgi:hypothetical protein
MTMGARKRDARLAKVERFCMNCKTPLRLYDEIEPTLEEAASFIDPESYACPKCRSETDSLYPDEIRSETRAFYRIGQRLRPCPGCAKCHPATRRFAPTAGWKSPRKWILWDGAKLWMIARTWRRLCTVPTLADYTSGVDDGTWKELFCDGSGVLPARAKKVRR